jgi:anaerobic magnesium-protoporphyrin IX monomethyl ester cyclase
MRKEKLRNKIVLVFPPLKDFQSKIPPIGLAYLASVIKNKGFEVSIYDLNVSGEDFDSVAKRIVRETPIAVGISSSTPAINASLEIASKIKNINRDIKIILGGPHPTIMYEEVLSNPYVDICVIGEGEKVMGNIINYLAGKKRLSAIRGIAYKKNENIILNTHEEMDEKLNNIPFPGWEFFDLKKYTNFVSGKRLSLPIVTSRGCPYNCSFCYKGVFGRRWRFRSPENILSEIEYLIKNFNIGEFSIVDDNFTLVPERAIKFCKLLINKKWNLKWRCTNGIRADSVSEKLLYYMKKAGCYLIAFGVETGDEKILEGINKGETLGQIKRAFRIAKKTGIETYGFFIFGNLGENKETMQKTINFAKRLDPDYVQFSIMTPFPGSPIYNKIKTEGEIFINSWKDYAFYAGRPIFRHEKVTPELMNYMYKRAYKEFYFRPRYILKWIFKIIKSPNRTRSIIKGFLYYLLNISLIKK